MDFTFGIVTNDGPFVQKIVESIKKQNIPNYEIIIVGKSNVCDENVKNIPFDENIRSGWITKKKNIITNEAKFENIVYLHDYVLFEDRWYNGFLKYGNNFKACMNIILNIDGSRYRDWVLHPFLQDQKCPIKGWDGALIPYDLYNLKKYQYFSGAYFVAKKDVMIEFPLNESICWGGGEDMDWCARYKQKYDFFMNSYSTVKLLKHQWVLATKPSEEQIKKLKEYV